MVIHSQTNAFIVIIIIFHSPSITTVLQLQRRLQLQDISYYKKQGKSDQ